MNGNVYSGDSYSYLLVLNGIGGANPAVSGTPSITIIQVSSSAAVVTAQPMVLLSGTQKVYKYTWAIPQTQPADKYIAIASYSVDLAGGTSFVAYTGVFIGDVKVGDSMISGKVALDATVSKDATVAKDTTVAHASDVAAINPANSSVIQAIKVKTDSLPSAPADNALLLTVQGQIQGLSDFVLSSESVDLTAVPNVLRVRRFGDNAVLATYTLTQDSSSANKTRTS